MSPRIKNFKAGSIIYFEGDKADSVFLLKQGKINLIYDNVQVGEKTTDQILAGEFFGVKSGLIRLPREETAKVTSNSVVFEFSAIEFETLIMKNTNIILKMLKVFSNQLRKVGKQIQSLVSNKISSEPADEFFYIGEYYLKNKKYKQATTVYQRYLNYYPSGKHAQLATKRLQTAKNALDSYGDGGGPAPILDDHDNAAETDESESSNLNEKFTSTASLEAFQDDEVNSSDEEKIYYKGVSFMSQGKYVEAFNVFKKILKMQHEEIKIMANFEIGKCFFFLNKFNECITHLKNFITKHSNYHEKTEVLYYIGNSYVKLGENSSAKTFFDDIVSEASEGDIIYRKALKALKEL